MTTRVAVSSSVTYDDLPDGACFHRPHLQEADYPPTPLPTPVLTPRPVPESLPRHVPRHATSNPQTLKPHAKPSPTPFPTPLPSPLPTPMATPKNTPEGTPDATPAPTPIPTRPTTPGLVTGPFMAQPSLTPTSVVAIVEYTGSFTVVGHDQASRTEYVRTQLKQMRERAKSKPVLLVISLAGVKVCSPDGKTVYMAHALRRISYATCDPENRQFSFLAREPKGHFSLQYCHAFLTHTPDQAEELNSIVGHAFRLAYAAHLQKSGATVRDVIPTHSHGNTPPLPNTLAHHPSQSHSHTHTPSPSGTPLHIHAQTHTTHTHPHQRACDHNCSPSPLQAIAASRDSSPSPSMRTPGSPALAALQKPSSLPGLHTHPENDNAPHSPDSENSNSPSELNSSKRIAEKPPLIKKLSVTLESTLNLEEDLHPLVTSSSSPSPSCQTSCITTNTSSSSTTSTAVVGYVNEKVTDSSGSCVHHADGQEQQDFDNKCRISDDVKLKRISQISVSSSASSGVVALDVSTSSTRSATPPPLPERSDSLTPPEEPHLKTAAWFQAGIPREIALEVLSHEPVGAFMVRESTSKPGCYALSLRVPRDFTVSGIAHYLIVKTNKGYKIKGFTKEFSTLTALITHHSVMPELLPCPLSLSRYNPTFTSDDQARNDSNDDDPDYNTLSDFRKMMADLNV
ncbi:tensin-1-like isoform X2 [Portunus trituberculatus]|uniref:tensin-1-like isoform X2 n=1 Tax=Portunus trituberculatus TaxID=210409 RepID=UPI001E1D01F4|nr:tensin-1-like isoform X2 [Portunus trituberculatus]